MPHVHTDLTNEKLVYLIQSGKDVKENLQKLYNQNAGIINKTILPYLQYSEKEDLMQEAFLGMWDAVKHFDLKAGSSFITYAVFWIRQRVSRYCRSTSRIKRIPEHCVTQIKSYMQFVTEYQSKYHKQPPIREICTALSLTIKKVTELQQIIIETDTCSLEQTISGTDLLVQDTVSDSLSLEKQIEEEEDRITLWRIVDSLEPPKSIVINGYYHNGLTLKQLSEMCGVSQKRIQEIRKEAIRILRKKEEIRQIAAEQGYNTSLPFKSSLQNFKNTRTSVVEYLAIENATREEHRQHLMSNLANLKLSYRRDNKDVRSQERCEELSSEDQAL